MHQKVQPVTRKELSQLIVTLYTLSIYISVHNQLMRTLFERQAVSWVTGQIHFIWVRMLDYKIMIGRYHKQLYSFFYQYFPTLFSGYTKLHNRPGRTRQHNRLQHANPATTHGGGLPSLGERLRPQLGAGLHTLRGCLPLLPGRLRTKLFEA